jgi:hypothetical protein
MEGEDSSLAASAVKPELEVVNNSAGEGQEDAGFLDESEWAAYRDDPLAVELKEKAEKKISALHERIRSLSAEMVDVKIKNGAPPLSNYSINANGCLLASRWHSGSCRHILTCCVHSASSEHLFIELESKFEAVSAELAETKATQHKLAGEHEGSCTYTLVPHCGNTLCVS